MSTLAEVMTPSPITVTARTPLRECARLLVRHQVRHLPVVGDDGALLGLIHDYQLRRFCTTGALAPSSRHAGRQAISLAVRAERLLHPDQRLLDGLVMLATGWEDAAIVVDEASRPVGIFTVHDAARIAQEWITPWWRVRQCMTQSRWGLPANMTVRRALRLMWREQREHVLVADEGRLCGALSLRDLVAVPPVQAAVLRDLCASEPPRIVRPESSVVEAAVLMVTYRVDCLPVLEGSRVCGLFTRSDLLRALQRTVNVATLRAS